MPNPKIEAATDQWAETELTQLLAEYYRLAGPEMERGGNFLWQLSERFESGKLLGWFIEHKSVWPNDTSTDNDGPYSTRAYAVQGMIDHLRAGIARARSWQED